MIGSFDSIIAFVSCIPVKHASDGSYDVTIQLQEPFVFFKCGQMCRYFTCLLKSELLNNGSCIFFNFAVEAYLFKCVLVLSVSFGEGNVILVWA